MAIDIDAIFRRGDRKLNSLLDYAVRAIQSDLIFTFLVHEYRQQPTTQKAVAIYDGFCAPQSAAKVSAAEMLPPMHFQLESTMRPLRQNLAKVNEARAGGLGAAMPPLLLPPKYLFDAVDAHLRKNSASLRSIRRNYRVRRSPFQNLPDGRMNAAQRHFVDKVWEPVLRPRLVAAGFRRVTAIA